jgi:nitroimidazol reductase NimA-like FMN-containing flavoprotein (pyridoxamine 5'-phosphate oxidase superfamily)/ribosomal protein S18 acetylase RimI-like enzyme
MSSATARAIWRKIGWSLEVSRATASCQERIRLVYQKSSDRIFWTDQTRAMVRPMRKEIFRMDRPAALAFLERAPVVHLASTGDDGAPVFRTVHGVVVDGALAFHGAPAGEKTEAIGREAVACAEEIVAGIPSYFIDPERACPATTFYRSVQVHGRIERIDDPGAKARVLAALMAKFQPEGGHVPIEAGHPLYQKAIAGILVLGISLERLDGKAKLGQNRTPEERCRLIEKLWQRGLPGDPRAIELLRAANPGIPEPAFLRAPEGATLVCSLPEADAAAAAELLYDAYWNEGIPREAIARAHPGSIAWVGARDASGALIGTARAIGDGAKRAWVYDVMVAPSFRGKGLGEAVVRLLLDHPAVRATGHVYLTTRDADGFYERFGFVDRATLPPVARRVVEMVRRLPEGGRA